MIKIAPYFLIMLLSGIFANCSRTDKIQGVYNIESKDLSSIITLYTDSTFIEKRKSQNESVKYRGHWHYLAKDNSVIETTIESNGMTIYTLTPKSEFKIQGNKMILLNENNAR